MVVLAFYRSADDPCYNLVGIYVCIVTQIPSENLHGMFEEMVSDLCHIPYIDQPEWYSRYSQVVAVNAAKFLYTLITADTLSKLSSSKHRKYWLHPVA